MVFKPRIIQRLYLSKHCEQNISHKKKPPLAFFISMKKIRVFVMGYLPKQGFLKAVKNAVGFSEKNPSWFHKHLLVD